MPGLGDRSEAGERPWTLVTAAACAVALLAIGCSTEDQSPVPVECKATPEAVARALERAPEPVTLGGTSIPDCFTRASDPADIQAMGLALTETAADLSASARARPESEAAVRLGYLVGAVEAGASGTQGIHDELMRRLRQELVGVNTGSSAFREGERAGRESG